MSILKGAPQTVNYLSFDGSNDYVDVGTLGNWFSQNWNDFTVEITFSTNSTVTSRFFGTFDGNDALALITNFQQENRSAFLVKANDKNYYTYTDSFIINNNEIHTLSIQQNNNNVTYSLNGNQGTTVVFDNENPTSASDFMETFVLGANNNNGNLSQFQEMNIYDFKIYNGSTLFLHYDMSEGSGNTLVDKAGNIDGTIIGATWQTETVPPAIQNIYYGQPTNYLSFDGNNDYVQLPNGINLDIADGYSISVKFSSTNSTGTRQFVTIDKIAGNRFFQTRLKDGKLEFIRREPDNTVHNIITPNTYTNGNIYDVTFTYSSSFGFKIYVDGVEILSSNETALNATYTTQNNDFMIGARVGNFGLRDFFDGNIYDVQFWNRSLTSTEINNFITNKPNGNESGLLVYYNFSEGSGTTLGDNVGNNDGTIVGATWGSETNEVSRVYLGESLLFGQPPLGTYELIADVIVTSNTTQIDFDNLNITKDDELRLVWTEIGSTSGSTNLTALYVNNNTNSSNYYWQQLGASGSSPNANRQNSNLLSIARSNQRVSGFADIKISNNNRFVYQSQLIRHLGSESNNIQIYYQNNVSTFAVSSITSLSVFCTNNQIATNSRFTLYKVNTGVA